MKKIWISLAFVLAPALTFTIFGVLYAHMRKVDKCDQLQNWSEKVACRNQLIECTRFGHCLNQPTVK